MEMEAAFDIMMPEFPADCSEDDSVVTKMYGYYDHIINHM